MSELVIDKEIIIDNAENALSMIKKLSGRSIPDLETVKKFINTEKNTRFYVNGSLNSSTQKGQDNVYVWLDTGYMDNKGNPIMISLLKNYDRFTGHFVGTICELSESAGKFLKLRKNLVDQRVNAFKKKYSSKVNERKTAHIANEREYLIKCCNSGVSMPLLAEKLAALNIEWEPEIEEEATVIAEVPEEETFSEMEEEITVGLLLMLCRG